MTNTKPTKPESGKFDCAKARKLAEQMIDLCDPSDEFFMRLAMTLRAACNEIEMLRAEKGAC